MSIAVDGVAMTINEIKGLPLPGYAVLARIAFDGGTAPDVRYDVLGYQNNGVWYSANTKCNLSEHESVIAWKYVEDCFE